MIEITEKTGFKNLKRSIPIIIKDHRDIMFYDSRLLRKPPDTFNLPAGKYYVQSGVFKSLPKPVNFKKIDLPKPTRQRPLPTDFEIKFEDRPDKAQINWDAKTITFDNSFLRAPLPTVYFILFHEYGHAYYDGTKDGEKYCDAFAHNMMIDRGFNPSQSGLSSILSLSDRQLERKHFLLDEILKK